MSKQYQNDRIGVVVVRDPRPDSYPTCCVDLDREAQRLSQQTGLPYHECVKAALAANPALDDSPRELRPRASVAAAAPSPQGDDWDTEPQAVRPARSVATRASWRLDAASPAPESTPPQKPTSWVKIFPIGEWEHPQNGRWVIDQTFCQQVVDNFSARVQGIDIALDLHHESTAAPGWIIGLEARPDGVWANVRWTPFGEDLIKGGQYRYVSPEWYWDFVRPSDGQHFANVLTGLALTNTPFFTELPALPAVAQRPSPVFRPLAAPWAQPQAGYPALSSQQGGGAPMAPQQAMTMAQASEALDKLAKERERATGESYYDAVKAVYKERQDLREAYDNGPIR